MNLGKVGASGGDNSNIKIVVVGNIIALRPGLDKSAEADFVLSCIL